MDEDRCRCCGTDMERSDHCPRCYCEQYEERCEWTVPWQERTPSERWGELLRRTRTYRG